ncbi:MAG TPA: hypothetical protein VFR85_04180 [Anaeromyxobacteraceae bacterium]|nr:hypothetical protein [Anaeromyxobacteraceae bacterium]
MSFAAQLWLPMVLSAVIVFAMSAASHMVLPWRRNEWGRITDFAAIQSAVRGLSPGQYGFPAAPDRKQQMTKEWMERWAKGPSGWLTLAPPGPVSMGRNMLLSFLAFLGVALLDGYVAWHALGPGASYRAVFRIVGTVGFLSFAAGTIFDSIWYSRPWRAYVSDVIDALLFALLMAGVFGWLWPR